MKPEVIATNKVFRCFGLGEASLGRLLREENLGEIRLGWRVVFPEILIEISPIDPQGGEAALKKAEAVIRKKVGEWIYAEGEETVERVIGRLLRERKKTLAVAESCTGGLIAHLITNVPGSSDWFERGVVAYSNHSKAALLKVDPKLIARHGAVSGKVAVAMAEGVRRIAKVTYGIGVTGIAGPTGGTKEKPVGTVHIAVAGPGETQEKKYFLPGDRERFKLFAAHTALHQLRRMILEDTSFHRR